MRAIGVDPSLTATGLAAVDIDKARVIAWTCIRTKPDPKFKATEDLARRLLEVATGVREFCTQHQGVMVIEGQVGSSFGKMSSMSTIFLLGAGYGACIASLPSKPIVLHSGTIKARVLGNRQKTTKDAAWEAAKVFFTEFPPEPTNKVAKEAVHDAVVTAVAALQELNQLQAMLPR